MIDKSKPDVLRVTEYVLDKAKLNTDFSVQSAASSKELNGIGRHRIAEIMRNICLDPNGEGSLIGYTTVDDLNLDNNFCRWQLNANSYFSYLSYQSVEQAKESNKTANKALWVAAIAASLTFMSIITSVIAS
jgi:hypothetical protein